jgi:hypothetical protein
MVDCFFAGDIIWNGQGFWGDCNRYNPDITIEECIYVQEVFNA